MKLIQETPKKQHVKILTFMKEEVNLNIYPNKLYQKIFIKYNQFWKEVSSSHIMSFYIYF